jgi:hypothetical protein
MYWKEGQRPYRWKSFENVLRDAKASAMTKHENKEFRGLLEQFIKDCEEHGEPIEEVREFLFDTETLAYLRPAELILVKKYQKAFKAWLTLLQ